MNPILHDFPHEFHTERLTIRCPMPGDGPAIYEAVAESLAELRPWLPWAMGEPSPAASETFARSGYSRFISREDLPLVLFLKNTYIVAGGSGLHRINWEVPRFEIGYWLRTSLVGQGYMTEAVTAVTQFAFETLHARRVEIRCDARNERSAAIPRRLGFVHEATLRHEARHHISHELRDTLIFAKLAPPAETHR
jgi:ribosomal-protein-serine acetyltransferase